MALKEITIYTDTKDDRLCPYCRSKNINILEPIL